MQSCKNQSIDLKFNCIYWCPYNFNIGSDGLKYTCIFVYSEEVFQMCLTSFAKFSWRSSSSNLLKSVSVGTVCSCSKALCYVILKWSLSRKFSVWLFTYLHIPAFLHLLKALRKVDRILSSDSFASSIYWIKSSKFINKLNYPSRHLPAQS